MNLNSQFQGVGFLEFILHTMPGVVILTLLSYVQIRYFTFKNIKTLQNEDPINVSNIKHELRMWANTDRSISAISKFDDISRSVIHNRVVLLNEALERELHSTHRHSTERMEPRSLSFYLSDKNIIAPKMDNEIIDDNDAHEQLTRRLENMVKKFFI